MKLTGDKWTGTRNDEWLVTDPTVSDFERALDRLDASTHSMLTIEADLVAHLVVGGGAGKYVVYASVQTDQFWNLVNIEVASGRTSVFAGGQEGEYPVRHVVGRDQALRAGTTFLTALALDTSQSWEKQ